MLHAAFMQNGIENYTVGSDASKIMHCRLLFQEICQMIVEDSKVSVVIKHG